MFSVGDCRVTAFRTSHDAAQSVDYRVDAQTAAVGFLTDTGFVTPEAEAALAGVDTAGAGEPTTTWSGSAAGPIPIP